LADSAAIHRSRQERAALGSGETRRQSQKFTVFLDRDGVFNRDLPLGVRWTRDFEWLPGAKAAFARLNRPDVQTCLCTNQPWVAQLMATPRMIRTVVGHLKEGLEKEGGRLDHIEIAWSPAWFPHRRYKPRPGLLVDGAKWFARQGSPVDKARAVMVGDKLKDAQAAAGFGCQAILLSTTFTAKRLREAAEARGVPYLAIVPDLPAAVEAILRML
jgi:D-glycero-D-manno-heptose 1,7-bisphosphate phosphatase